MGKVYLTCKDVCERFTFSKATLYRMLAEDQFPQPVKIGKRNTRWHITGLLYYENFMQRIADRKSEQKVG